MDKTIIQFTEADLEGIELNPTAIINELNDKIMEWGSELKPLYESEGCHSFIEETVTEWMSLKSVVIEYRIFKVKTYTPKKTLEDYMSKADEADRSQLLKYFQAKYEPSVQDEL